MEEQIILGVDVGGSGIKGALVDVQSGEMKTERIRLLTPKPATPDAVAKTFKELVDIHKWSGRIGCGFPAIIKNGIAYSAANVDKSWINTNVEAIFSEASSCPVKAVNDADAAGLAEMRFGAGKGKNGVVIMITIGSGLGSALFINGQLVPNTEFGHFFLHNQVAEHYASNNARQKYDLSWEDWGKRFNEYLNHIERLFSPDLVMLGGGISKRYNDYKEFIDLNEKVIPAKMLNNAGTIGAACFAHLMAESSLQEK